ARWDVLSRKAGVVEGIDQWQERLDALAKELESSDRDWRKEDADRARGLIEFVSDLDAALQALPESASWGEQLAALKSIFETYIEDPSPLLEPLEGLQRFDALGREVSRQRFAEFIAGAIENLRTDQVLGRRGGAFGRRGVNVLDVNSMRHLRFRAVAVV